MNWFQNFVARLLNIIPARDRSITIREAHTFRENVIKNKLWYQGDSAELEQFFKKTARWDVEKARFWAAHAQGTIRKMHSGIVATVVDRYKDIVLADLDAIEFGENATALDELWKELYQKAELNDVIGKAITGTLAAGDGAFKISADECSPYPIVEFYDAEDVDYVYIHSTLREIKFYTTYKNGNKDLRLEETYGFGYVRYKLYDDRGKEVPMSTLPETAHLIDFGIEGDLMLTVPMRILNSAKYKNRGKALFDSKTDVLDGLDEVISQWMDAIRMGRIKRYIPDSLIPRDPETGELMPANPFDNDFIAIGDDMSEKSNKQVEISQPQISYEAYEKQLDTLKAAAGNNEELKQQITTLQEQNKQKDADYKKELDALKMTNAIKMAIAATAQDSDLVAGLVDRNKLILSDDGKITGLDEQLKTIKESKPFLFKQEGPKPSGKKGFFPLGPKEKGGEGEKGQVSMKEAIAARLNLGTEGKGE